MSFEQFFLFGTVYGAILALLASGYSLAYGVGGILNLAHGAFYILTGYIIFWIVEAGIVPYSIAIILGLLIITIIGALTYVLLIKPAEERGEINVMIVTFILAFVILQIILIYEGSLPGETRFITLESLVSEDFIPGTIITPQDILIVVGTFVIMTILIVFIKKSKIGNSIRAVSQDKEAAQLMGINVHMILMFTVALSALLAGIAAVLYMPAQGPLMTYIAWDVLLLSMSVVVLGGLGSLPGSVIGAFIISYIKFFTFIYIDTPNNSSFSALVHLVAIIIVLLIRPQGLLGKKQRA